jgi:hypothetical protein
VLRIEMGVKGDVAAVLAVIVVLGIGALRLPCAHE